MIQYLFLSLLFVIVAGIILFLNHPLFGKKPSGKRLERIQKSPQYKNKQFKNFSATPQLADGYSMPKVVWEFLFKKSKNGQPENAIPVIPIDFSALDFTQDAYFWLGHSSYLLIIDGKTYLIDPVLTENAAPVIRANKAFKGTTFINLQELPSIDFLVITHDHYDHLDYTTVRKIKNKVQNVVCGLGVGSHLEHWGYAAEKIHELDWWESTNFEQSISFTATPARHFSGRSFLNPNNTLFCSFVLKTAQHTIFIGGDSGYDTHFKKIGDTFGPFDLAFIENGQYNAAWRYIHSLPEETPLIIQDIQSKVIVPVHHSKFALALHGWKEPLEQVTQLRNEQTIIQTPKMGEKVAIGSLQNNWENWWKDVN